MDDKLTSIIESLSLDTATFEGTNEKIQPTFINFFFGGNGTGKSTIAKTIAGHHSSNTKMSNGENAGDYDFLLFNQEFIDSNFASYEGLAGVLTIEEENIQANKELDDVHTRFQEVEIEGKQLADELETKKSELTDLGDELEESIWSISKDFKKEFSNVLGSGVGSKSAFADKVKNTDACEDVDIDDFREKCSVAFSKSAQTYTPLTLIQSTNVLDDIEGLSLLEKSIVSGADTDLSTFINKIGALDWVRDGHSKFHESAGQNCPYCSQLLPDDFEQKLSDCFDEQYKENIRQLNVFRDEYTRRCSSVLALLERNLQNECPDFRNEEYKKLLDNLKAVTELNKALIAQKCNQPSLVVDNQQWNGTTDLLSEVNSFIDTENQRINRNNVIVANQSSEKEKCRFKAWSYIRFLCNDAIDKYKDEQSSLMSEKSEIEVDLENLRTEYADLDKKIKSLNSSGINVQTTIDEVNQLLKDAGFQGFTLSPHAGGIGTYDVVRNNGTVAENLSEGERNFIAFLYFYQTVMGKGVFRKPQFNEQNVNLEDCINERKKIVVIDDPVSSLDATSLFLVSSLVKNLINICWNSTDYRNQETEISADGQFIKQIFIMTHNPYFHNAITNGLVSDFECVSLYTVKKHENRSSVLLCTRKVGPQRVENYNPVKNSYSSLWDELKGLYKHAESAYEIQNVSKRILEHYFLQLCGCNDRTLHKTIITHINETPSNLSENEKLIIQSLLRFLNMSASVSDDQLFISDEGVDLETHRQAFKRIFEIMGQEQHYKMMMGIE